MKFFVITLFLLISIFAYSNDFYLGDKIKLRIENVPESEIREKFQGFEIEKLEQDKNGVYFVEMRSFEVGTTRINIGGQEIIFNIVTNLTGEEKDIFMDLTDMSNRKLFMPQFPYWTIAGILLFAVGLYFALKKIVIPVPVTPEEKYRRGMASLDDKTWNFQVSYLVREYIDSTYQTNFLSGIYEKVGEITTKEINFIKELDYVKFSGKARPEDLTLSEDNSHIKKANEIFDRIYSTVHAQQEEENKINHEKNSSLVGKFKILKTQIINNKITKDMKIFGGKKHV